MNITTSHVTYIIVHFTSEISILLNKRQGNKNYLVNTIKTTCEQSFFTRRKECKVPHPPFFFISLSEASKNAFEMSLITVREGGGSEKVPPSLFYT